MHWKATTPAPKPAPSRSWFLIVLFIALGIAITMYRLAFRGWDEHPPSPRPSSVIDARDIYLAPTVFGSGYFEEPINVRGTIARVEDPQWRDNLNLYFNFEEGELRAELSGAVGPIKEKLIPGVTVVLKCRIVGSRPDTGSGYLSNCPADQVHVLRAKRTQG